MNHSKVILYILHKNIKNEDIKLTKCINRWYKIIKNSIRVNRFTNSQERKLMEINFFYPFGKTVY